MSVKQLILFEETREDMLENRLHMLEDQMDRVRKNLFAKYTELMQLYLEQKQYIDILKVTEHKQLKQH